jgi:tetratricopeptide (TPR) repeat protein
MRHIKPLATLSISLLLSACAGLTGNWSKPNEAVDHFLAEQKYSKAMEVIASVDNTNPDYDSLQQRRKLILAEIKQFEDDSINLQYRYKTKQQWPEAIDIVDNAIMKLPTSQKLINTRQQLIKDRDSYINEKQLNLAISQANSLPQALELLEKINTAKPKQKEIEQEILVTRGQSHSAQKILLSHASLEFERKNWRTAKKYLILSIQLKPDQEGSALLTKTDRQIKLEDSRTKKSRHKIYLKNRDGQLEKLEIALHEKNYLQAKNLAQQLKLSKKSDQQITAALAHYQQTIDSEVDHLTSKGQQLYTKGLIDHAIEHWQQALLLEPSNSDIQERLRRAETFKANIEKYK